jgi:ribosomal protein S18 acetylase RimI-like enzyme
MKSPNGRNGKRGPARGNGASPPPAALTVRPATAGDVVPLSFFFDAMLRKDYFLRRGQLADMLRSPYHRVFVAEIDTVLVGAAVTTKGTRLVNALVHPAYRGLGIGRALVQHSGATEVRVKVNASAGDPRGFYRALGFAPAGRDEKKGTIETMRLPTGNPGR